MYLLAQPEKNEVEKSGSLMNLLKLPSVLITCIILIVTAMTCSYLDPTLEPHMRKFNLSPSQVGLLFLLESGTYGIFSPVCGFVADKIKNYTWLMTTGLFGSSIVLLFLGPSPIFTFMEDSIWLNIAVLAALGVFIAMSLIPTYQFILDSSMENGFVDCLGTQSVIAGLWSSVNSLGEVLGPVIGGSLMEHFGFPITSTTFAFLNFAAGVVALVYFKARSLKSKRLAERKGVDNVIFYVEPPDAKNNNVSLTTNNDNVLSIRL